MLYRFIFSSSIGTKNLILNLFKGFIWVSFLQFLAVSQLSAQVLNVNVSSPGNLSICGSTGMLTVTVSTTGAVVTPISNAVLSFDTQTGISASPTSVNIGTINPGDVLMFDFITQADCDYDVAADASTELGFSVNHDPYGAGMDNIASGESNTVQIQEADLSIGTTNPTSVNAYNGLEFDVDVTVNNGGNGELEEFTYCVTGNANVQLNSLTISGVVLPGPGPCFTIGMTELTAAGEFPFVDASIIIQENWEVIGCASPSPPVAREVAFGCGTTPSCDSDNSSTGLIYGVAIPDLQIALTDMTYPSCYASVDSDVEFTITNNGTGTANDINFTLNANQSLDLASISISSMGGGSTGTLMINSSSIGGCGGGTVDATLDDVSLESGECIIISYTIGHDCACNDCSIEDIYGTSITLENWTDYCDAVYDTGEGATAGGYNANLGGFVEGPLEMLPGDLGMVEYVVNSIELDWMNASYPNAYIEVEYEIPCGLDYTPGSAVWTDRDGTVWTSCADTYMDTGGDDTFIVRFCQSSRPSGFSISAGSSFTLEVAPDCSEKTIPMGACGFYIFDLQVDQTTYFSTDINCTMPCERQKLWEPSALDIRISCPVGGSCVCEGLVFSQFTMERTTYGVAGDANNDQVPDGAIDPNLIQLDRFIQGDTIKALYQGVVSDPMTQDWRYGFSTLNFDHNNFTPISAQFIFHDNDASTIDTVNTIPITIDGMDLVLDWSLDTLIALGAGIDPLINYDDGDSISLCVNFQIKEPFTGMEQSITYDPTFYLSDAPYTMGTIFSCNSRRGRLTQVGLQFDENSSFSDFGGCDLPDWEIEYRRHYGGRNFDEFPYEIRPVGLPKTITFRKPAEFEYRLDEFEVQLRQLISPANNIVQTSDVIPLTYLIQNGDEVTFLAEDYFNSLGNTEIPPDEGYRIRFYPKIQGGCRSISGAYPLQFWASESVDQGVYCTPMLMRDTQTLMVDYNDGARLEIEAAETNIVLCGGADTVDLLVNSVLVPDAVNAFLYWNSPDGGAIISKVINTNSGVEILPNSFGIFPLGTIDGGTSLPLSAVVIVNDCASTTVDFIAGWDCESIPTTVEEALCSDPSSISFTAAPSGMNLNILAPVNDTTVNFCDPIPYELEIISTELGYLRDFEIFAYLPPGQEFQSGSLQIAYPSISEGGSYANVGYDPTPAAGGFYLDVAAIRPEWVNNGLIGAKDLDLNKISLRFITETTCGYISGRRAGFILRGNDNCGDPIRSVRKRTRRAFVSNMTPSFQGDITLSDLTLNPCNNEMANSFVSFELTSGGPTANLDSIIYILPSGLSYVSGSYNPSSNMPASEPSIRLEGGNQVLVWPLNVGLMVGDIAAFQIGLLASDVAQPCAAYDLEVLAYSGVNASCNGMPCSYGIVAGQTQASATIEKPDLSFNTFNANLVLLPPTDEELSVTAEVCNNGAVLQSGQSVTVDIYEDIDQNGFRSAGDLYLYSLTEVLTSPLNTGDCITLSGYNTFSAGTVCTIIGLLNPETTCTCNEQPSGQLRPEMALDFDMDIVACSGSNQSIGPMPTTGYSYDWLSLNGSPLSALSATNMTPVDFMMDNFTGTDIQLQYVLRSSFNNCYEFDTVSITLSAAYNEIFNVLACQNGAYQLPSPGLGGSNFIWSPSTNLTFPGPDSSYAVVDPVTVDQTYTLNFISADGCPGMMTVNLTALNCGTAAASLGDYVWFDFNEDGIQDANELPIEGVIVQLYDALTGALVGTTTTDENGYYLFDNLPQGTYYVDFAPLPGFSGTINNQGMGVSQDSLDSDADPVTGETDNYFLAWGEHNPTIDAGFIPDCSLDINMSISECIVNADTLARQVDINLTWNGNPYTYNQFFGVDTLSVDLAAIGQTLTVLADTLFGDTTLTIFINPNSTTSLTANAAFAYANACIATSETINFEPCIFDLALKKESTNGTNFSYGDTICLDIIVFNQAIQSVTNVNVIDYLPDGFGFLPMINPDWALSGNNLVSTITDTLAFGESDTIPLKVELLMATGANAWTNFAEITAFEDTMGMDRSMFDIDSTPDDDVSNDAGGNPETASDDVVEGNGSGNPNDTDPGTDEDDHDPFRVEIFDLALIKTITTPPPYSYGQLIDFSITVSNQGNVAAKNIKVSDYIPLGFSWDASNEPDWMVMNNISTDLDTAMTTIADTIQPGEITSVSISLTLEDADPDQYINIAEIASAQDEVGNPRFDDIDSTPDNDPTNDGGGNPGSDSDNVANGDGTANPNDTDPTTDEDDQDPAFVSIPLIELTKSTISVVPSASGSTGNFDVTFQLELDNIGNTKLTNVQLIDNMSSIFGASFIQVNALPTVVASATSVPALQQPTLNSNYNGAAFDSLFTGTDGCILPDDSLTLQVAVEVTAFTGVDSVINQATVTASDTLDTPTMDSDTAVVRIPNCFLDVVCPSPNGGTFDCIADLPAAANSVATFNAIDGGSSIRNACGPTTVTPSVLSDTGSGCPASPRVITRRYIIVDGSGVNEQRDTCEQSFTIIDDEAPVVVCPPTLYTDCSIDSLPAYASQMAFVNAGGYVSDNCGIVSFSLNAEVSDGEICPETFTRTYRLTDNCGNATDCVQRVIINDETPPQISCPTIATDCALSDIPAYADFDAFLADGNTASDNCGLDSASFTLVQESTDANTCPQIVVRKYSIEDNCGNIAFSTQIITIDDETVPVFTINAPADTTVDCSASIPGAAALAATDNCGTPNITFTETSTQTNLGRCTDYSYMITRQWVATDGCNNFSTETQILTVQDTTPPTVTCCADFTISVGSELDGIITLSEEDINCGSTDDCTPDSLLTYVVSPNSFDANDIGAQTVTLYVYDLCGNVDSCMMTVTVTENPEIGLAKRVVNVTNNADGSATVVYEFNIENFGDVDLDSIQVVDDLSNVFTGTCTVNIDAISSDDFTVNSNFGNASDWNLLTGNDNLLEDDKGAILLTITVDSCGTNQGPYNNTATVSAESPGGSTITDDSVDGSDPDGPTDDNDPSDSSDTPVTFSEAPSIGGAKRAVDVVNNGDGSYTVIYEINIENFGDVDLDSIQAVDDLSSTFPSPCTVDINLTSDDFTVNTNYGISNDWNLLTGADDLPVGDQGAILLTVTVDSCGTTGTFSNTATVSGSSPDGTPVTDDTEDGADPDPDGNNTPEEDSSTDVDFSENPVIGLAKRVVNVTNNADGSATVVYEFNIENFGDVILDSLQVVDDLSNVFTGTCTVNIEAITSDDFTVNSNFGIGSDWNLLTGLDNLPVDDQGAILLTVRINDCGTNQGPYNNTATVTADSPTDTTVTDDSVNGSDPDGPTDNDDPSDSSNTPVTFEENPVIGGAKRVVQVVNNGNGSYTVTYEFNIENFGDVDLDSIQAVDDLSAVFTNPCDLSIDAITSDDFTANPNYGNAGDWNLLSGNDDLPLGDKGAVLLTITVDNCGNLGPFINQATVSGESPSGMDVSDDTTNGSDPDGATDDDDPSENASTPVSFTEDPVLGLAKRVSEGPMSNGDGTYTLTFEIRAENNGNINLDSLQITDDLASVFGTDCQWQIDGLASEEFTVNTNYNGDTDTNLLTGDDELKSWNEGAVYLTITVGPCSNLGPFSNSAVGMAETPTGDPIMDTSQTGSEPDSDGDGDTDDNDDPTEFEFEEMPSIGVAKRAVDVLNNGDGSYTVIYEINIENFGDVDLDSIQAVDDLSATFPGPCTVDAILTSDDFIVNSNYGNASDWNLLSGNDDLPIGDKGAILLTVTIDSCATNNNTFSNTVTASGESPTGMDVSDNSEDGADPDPDGNNTPDEESTTDITLTENALIGLAKRSVEVVNNPDGSAFVTYEFNIENFGDVNLDSIQVRDSLFLTFPGPCQVTVQTITSDDFIVNENFNGNTDFNLLTGGDDLPIGDKGSILVTILVENCGGNPGPYNNNAYVDAYPPSGTPITDESTPGADPDPNGNGNPEESGPTVIMFEQIARVGIAKNVVAAEANPDGSFDITYEFNVENFGSVELDSIQVFDNLMATFPNPCTIEVVEITSDNFTVNDDEFDGVTVFEMLEGNDILEVGGKGAIILSIHVEMCGSNLGPFNNNARVEADDPGGNLLEDMSVDGSEPDPNLDGNPGENSPTVVSFVENPGLALTKRVSEGPSLDADDYYVLTYEIRAENIGDVNLEALAFYDTLANTFAGAANWMILSVESEEFAVNTSYDGITNTNLIDPEGEILTPGEEGAIYLTVRVAPGGDPGPYLNSVTGSMITPFGTVVSDVSQDGTDPDPDNDGDSTNDNEPTPVTLDCFVNIICPAVVDTISVENDQGWCRAMVNFPPAEIETCAGAVDSLIEFMLEGVGAFDTPLNTWIEGQPSGLSYLVGLTRVSMRASIPGDLNVGYSDTCVFHIEVLDKEDPEILCQDITVPVGSNCEYILTPDRIDAGTIDNCTAPTDMLFEISLDNQNYVDELIFDLDDLNQSPITVYLRVTDEAGNEAFCTAEVNLIDDTNPQIICPEDMLIYAEPDLCVGYVPDLRPDLTLDNCAPIDTVIQEPFPGTLFGTAHEDMIDVVLTVIDIHGNTDTCAVKLTLIDTIPPSFLNCPQPDIKVNTLPGMCGAFVNFTLPLAEDNCAIDRVEQTDVTGLTSGDMFPVGTSILEFTAFDLAGNSLVCTLKVIVNDKAFPEPVANGCPDNMEVNMDIGECGAYVHNLEANFTDNCQDNLSVIYQIEDIQGNPLSNGMTDASGSYFEAGTSIVRYRAQDQPLLLISEISHDLQASIGGTNPVPAFINSGLPEDDFLEITNFGPASIDVSCLTIERIHTEGFDIFNVPRGVILNPGEVLTIHFGDGTDDFFNHFFNVADANNLAPDASAAYILSLSGVTLDVAVLGNYFQLNQSTISLVTEDDWSGITANHSGAIIRNTVWDTNTEADFSPALVCHPTTIGSFNPDLSFASPNGSFTALQAQTPNVYECIFTVTVTDIELPQCGAYTDYMTYELSVGNSINMGDCMESIISIPDNYEIADLNISLEGNTEAFGNLSFNLISPNGTNVELANAICGNFDGYNLTFDNDVPGSIVFQCQHISSGESFFPVNSLDIFNGETVQGDWVLQIGHSGGLSDDAATLLNWSLEISARAPFMQEDIMLENEPGECQANFTWNHPVLFDNCAGGSMTVEFVDETGAVFSNGLIAENDWGGEESFDFPVGVTTVNYFLTDNSGNQTECGFTVEVEDTEAPVLVCPDDVEIQLGPGECDATISSLPNLATDNCHGLLLSYDPPIDTVFDIGTTPVVVTVTDLSGNSTECTFNVTVLEYIPENPVYGCNSEINVSLGPDCTTEITADMILEGDDYRCYENYIITICTSSEPNAPEIATSPFVTLDHVGQQLVVKVCDPDTDECCWGYINVNFYEAPEFVCPADTTVTCNADISPLNLGEPIVLSCVPGGATISYQDVIQENEECDDPRVLITRTWTVSDGVNNVSTCNQLINIAAFDLNQIEFPEDLDNISLPALACEAVIAMPDLVHPDSTGYPTVDGSTDVFGVNYCSASFLWTDEIFNICPGSYEILRTWKIRNTCEPVVPGSNPLEHIQVIKVLDQNGPDIFCPDTIRVSTSPFSCMASLNLPVPEITDGCSAATFTASINQGALTYVNDVFVAHNLPIGAHEVHFTARDACGKTSSCSSTLIVEDQVEPTAICDDDLHISIGGDGVSRVYATDVDEGSNDNCAIDRIEIRRQYKKDENCQSIAPFMGEWEEYVDFNCCDVNDSIRIELRVTDIYGNENICWNDVLIEDKSVPYCTAPHTVNILCSELPYGFDSNDLVQLETLFGSAETSDNCSGAVIEELMPTLNLNDCGVGTITRQFRAIDLFGNISTNYCDQTINILEINHYAIKFPKDTEANCGMAQPDTIATFEFGCDLLAVNVEDELFTASADECYKILRTYNVINWCEYDGEADPVVVGRDEDCDQIPGDEDIWVIVGPGALNYYDRDSIPSNNIPIANTKGTTCDDLTNPTGYWKDNILDPDMISVGYWQYTQAIKVYDNQAPIVNIEAISAFCSIDNENCNGSVQVPFQITDDCPGAIYTVEVFLDINADGIIDDQLDIEEVLEGEFPNFSLNGTYPIGYHSFEVHIEDGCGNSTLAVLPFEVADCKAPAPICLSSITVGLMPLESDTDADGDGEVDLAAMTIWATDFIASPIEDCSDPIQYSINRVGETPDQDQHSLTVTCDDLGTVAVEIYAWDNTFNPYAVQPDGSVGGSNYDYCESVLEVQDNQFNLCSGGNQGALVGIITTEEDNPVEGVEINISGNGDFTELTSDDGAYQFTDLQFGYDYSLSPYLNIDYKNGVSTFDLILITKHILGVSFLDSPYKMIAADANNSQSVSTLDLILLRKLILGTISELPDNTSWRFVERAYDFPEPTNPWLEEFPEVISINDMSSTLLNQDFIAVKIGDVNLTAQTSNLMEVEERNRDGIFTVSTQNQSIIKGQEVEVVLSNENLNQIEGFQFTFDFDSDALDIISIDHQILKEEHIGRKYESEGAILLSWNQTALENSNDTSLISFKFTAKVSGNIKEFIGINSRRLLAEAYHRDGRFFDIALEFKSNPEVASTFELYQNKPNPFDDYTLIGFELPEAMEANLVFRDVNGRVIHSIQGGFVKGKNLIQLESHLFQPGSIIYYTLKAGAFIKTRKMVCLK